MHRRPLGVVIVSILQLILGVAWHAGGLAWACSCAEPLSPREAREQAAVVFSGTVESVKLPDDDPAALTLDVSLAVTNVWKGVAEPRVHVSTARNEAACGFAFLTAREYLVYASRDETGTLRTSLCSRTRLMNRAEDDLRALGPAIQFPSPSCRAAEPAKSEGVSAPAQTGAPDAKLLQ